MEASEATYYSEGWLIVAILQFILDLQVTDVLEFLHPSETRPLRFLHTSEASAFQHLYLTEATPPSPSSGPWAALMPLRRGSGTLRPSLPETGWSSGPK